MDASSGVLTVPGLSAQFPNSKPFGATTLQGGQKVNGGVVALDGENKATIHAISADDPTQVIKIPITLTKVATGSSASKDSQSPDTALTIAAESINAGTEPSNF